MEQFIEFFNLYGLWLTVIAVAGVILLGILKYLRVFDKFSKGIRHLLYLLISVGVSVIGSIVYLACEHSLDIEYILSLALAIFALNQIAYTVYNTTPLRSLLKKLWTFIKNKMPTNIRTFFDKIEGAIDSASPDEDSTQTQPNEVEEDTSIDGKSE